MEARFKKMATKCSKNTTFLLLITFPLLLDSNAVHGWERLSEEEDLELERQLQLINKPAIKSFQIEYGDIVDCIDIYKQLAFDHPLLKNHAIQMKPKTIPKGMKDEGSTTDVFPTYVANISCPLGSVPIRRTTKEDLIMDKYQKFARRNYLANKSLRTSANDFQGFHVVAMASHGNSYGAKATINVWNPTVSTDQYSRANIKIIADLDVISVGWEVRKWNYSRLYISWSIDGVFGFECINVACPGFIQVSHKITIGSYLQPSTFGGKQYGISVGLFQDLATGNWWFMLRDQHIGYWPQGLFGSLREGGKKVLWGGHTSSPTQEFTPAMGSGHFPKEGYGKSAYIRGIEIINSKTRGFAHPSDPTIEMDVSPYCYNGNYEVSKNPQWGYHMFFGGPGRCTYH